MAELCGKKYDGGMNMDIHFIPPTLVDAKIELAENEKHVFDALVTFQMARSVSTIARKAGVPRTTTAYILNKFVKLNVAKKVEHGRRHRYLFIRKESWLDHKRRFGVGGGDSKSKDVEISPDLAARAED